MKTYCVKCRKHTENLNSNIKKKKKKKKGKFKFLKKLSNNFLKKLLNSLETAQANVLAWLFLRI